MAQVVTFGEAMLRLSPPGRLRLEQARTLEVWPAGAELNVAVGLAKLGEDVRWVSRVPSNPLGEIVLAHARSFGIDVSGVLHAEEGRLGLYFVEVSEPPLASRALYDRSASAFALLDPGDFDWAALLAGARAFHVTGITAALSDGCARAAAEALEAARAAGCATSYDLNLRTRLAPPEDVARPAGGGRALARHARLLGGGRGRGARRRGRARRGSRPPPRPARDRARRRLPPGRGRGFAAARDARPSTAAAPWRRPLPRSARAEPVGAGDAFCAGLLSGLLAGDLERGVELGGAMAAVKQSVPGDAPVVGLEELELALTEDPRMRR